MREVRHRMPRRRSNMKISFVVQGGFKSNLRMWLDRAPVLIKSWDRSRPGAHHALHFPPIEMKTTKLLKQASRLTIMVEVSHHWGLSRLEKEVTMPETAKPISKMNHLIPNRTVTKRAIDSCTKSNKSSSKNSKSREVDRRESMVTEARSTTSSRTLTARRNSSMRSFKILRTSFALWASHLIKMTSETIKVWTQQLSSPTITSAKVKVSIARGLRIRIVIRPLIRAKGGWKTRTLRWLCEEEMKPKTLQQEHTHRETEAGAAAPYA